MIDDLRGCTFEELGHTAEIGMRVRAAAPADLFICAGRAMFALIGAEADPNAELFETLMTLEAIDMESLMVDWLSELVYLHETTGVIFEHIVILHWSPTALSATVSGRRAGQTPHMQIKAVTYHDLVVQPESDGWVAQIYFDI